MSEKKTQFLLVDPEGPSSRMHMSNKLIKLYIYLVFCSCFASDFFQVRSIDRARGLVSVGLRGLIFWSLGMKIMTRNGFRTQKNQTMRTTPVLRPTETRARGRNSSQNKNRT